MPEFPPQPGSATLREGTLGACLGRRSVGGLIVSETEHRSGFHAGRHAHENASINIVVEGIYQESCGGSSAGHGPSTLIAKPAGDAHANHFPDKGARCLLLEVTAERAARLGPAGEILRHRRVGRAGAALAPAIAILRELRRPDAISDLAIEAFAVELLVAGTREAAPSGGRPPRWMARAVEILHECRETPSLEAIAGEVMVHPTHLAREFRRRHGRTIGAYARQLRIERAVALLERSDRTLADVAGEAGFYDQSHMAKWVKSATGQTPRELRGSAGAKPVPTR